MSNRAHLPNRRTADTFVFELGGIAYTCTVGKHADGRIGELFLNSNKINSSADTAARDSAIVASLALQYGADIETIRKSLCRDSHGRAIGPLGAALDAVVEGK